MDGLSEDRRALLESVATEFLQNSWRGRRLVAVEGASDDPAARFADDLAAILGERGQHAVRVSVGDVDEATLREHVAAHGNVPAEGVDMRFGGFTDLDENVRRQVAILREHPYLRRVPVHGLVFDVANGGLTEVA